jgi:8-amino-7-oxononanoate synthase
MVLAANHSTLVTIADKEYLYLGGTNYLGLAHRVELMAAAQAAFDRFGFSAGASRVTSGENDALLSLERELAAFADAQEAFVLPAGFLSNQAVVEALDENVDAWVIGRQAHVSIRTALKLSSKPRFVGDWDSGAGSAGGSFRKRFGLGNNTRLGVFAEPIDPLPGRIVDINAVRDAMEERDYLILDEAHSFGVLGERGIGAQEHFAMGNKATLIRTGTFSKALGSYGGFILASKETLDLLKHKSSIYKGSTALPPPVCAAAHAALRLLRDDASSNIDILRRNIQYLALRLQALNIAQFVPSATPIFYLPNSSATAHVRKLLFERGVYIPTSSSYFGDFCEVGLRWTIQAGHTLEQLDLLVKTVAESL